MTPVTAQHEKRTYVLATAAYNEEANIEHVLSSVVRQSSLPRMWVIVSDGSTDRTDAIVRSYADRYDFIRLHRINEQHARNFSAQAIAINTGFSYFRDVDHRYIGNLDADISLDADYFEKLIDKFEQDQKLGLAGGFIHELSGGVFRSRTANNSASVAHGVQMFRRECFASMGGYVPLPHGGPDWHAEITARRAGWRVHSFPELKCLHHRVSGGASGRVRYCFHQGLMDYSLGSDPCFEAVKLAKRIPTRPYLIGAISRFAGFLIACWRRPERPVSSDFVRYLRGEQRARLRGLLSSAIDFGTRKYSAQIGSGAER